MLKKKKQLILFIAIITILLVSSFSYAWFIYSDVQDDSHIGTTACFKLSFDEGNDISLRKAIPVEDLEGKTYTPYTFTITNVCDGASSYYVTLEELEESNIDLNGVRYQLNNDEVQTLGSIVSNSDVVLDNAKSSKTLASGILIKGETISYDLRLWVDINSTAEQTAEKIFKSKVVVISNWNKEPYWNLTLADGLNHTADEVQVVKGRNIGDLPELTTEKYQFLGWYDSDDNEVTSTTIINSDTTIYAKWEKVVFTITYNGNGGTPSKSSEEVRKGETISSMPTASKNATAEYSYSLSGWYSALSNGTKIDETTPIYEDKELYAYWGQTANKYTVSLNKGNFISSVSGNGTYSYGQTVTVSATTNTNYTESGWSGSTAATPGNVRYHVTHNYSFVNWTGTKSSTNKTFSFTMPAQNVTLTANGNHTTGTSGSQTYQLTGYRRVCWWIERVDPDGDNDGETGTRCISTGSFVTDYWDGSYDGNTLNIYRNPAASRKYDWYAMYYVEGITNIQSISKFSTKSPNFTFTGIASSSAIYEWR